LNTIFKVDIMNHKLSVSILDSDFANLKDTIIMLAKSGADWIHFDVMDGDFVPNLTFGAKIIKSLRKLTSLPFDTHLMIKNPEKYLPDFIDAGCDVITIHYEATKKAKKIIENLKQSRIKTGISIKPHTPIDVLKDYLPDVDLVLVMSVEPGFGGQKFMKSTLQKVKSLKKIKEENNYNYMIEIDGGINPDTAPLAIKAGADVLVSGNAIFASKNPVKTIKNLKKIL